MSENDQLAAACWQLIRQIHTYLQSGAGSPVDNRSELEHAIRQAGYPVAVQLETRGVDTAPLLRLLHCAGPQDGTREAMAVAWADAWSLLHRAAIRLRLDAFQSTAVPRREEVIYSPDCRSVRWFGSDYSFTPTQAAIVAELLRAWKQGTPDVGHETLLQKAGAETQRLADLFRNHLAWRTMIVPGSTKGTSRLQKPA